MDLRLQIFLSLCCLGFIGLCLQLLRKGAMEYKYALLWLAGSIVMLLCVLFPTPLFAFAGLVGIIDPVNMVFFIAFFLTLLIIFVLSVVVSRLSVRIRRLTQAMALLEKRVLDGEASEQIAVRTGSDQG